MQSAAMSQNNKQKTLTQRDDLLERCDLAREGNSERRACSELKAQCAFTASEVCLRLD